MSKFKVGDEMWIHTKICITGIHEGKSGQIVYATDKEIHIREAILDQIKSPAPEPKYYTGKVVCTGYYYGYEWAFRDIVGRILIIENGKCINQNLTGQRIESFAHLCSILNKATWMEVKD